MAIECDYCDTQEILTDSGDGKKQSNLKKIGDSLVCSDCEARGVHAANSRQIQAGQNMADMNAPININEVLRQARDIDAGIQRRTDLFNAATVSIAELKKAIDEDANITNKPFTLATELLRRINDWKLKIFELNEQVVEAQNNQMAIQTHLNQLANQLREDEREKLKLHNINYRPGPVKAITPKAIKQTKKKYSTKEIREACVANAINGIPLPEITVTMLLTAKQVTLGTAIAQVKSSIESAQKAAETNGPTNS